GADDGDPAGGLLLEAPAADPSALADVGGEPRGDSDARRGRVAGADHPPLAGAKRAVARLVSLAPARPRAARRLAVVLPRAGDHRHARAALRQRVVALRSLARLHEHPLRLPGADRSLPARGARGGRRAAVPVPALVSGRADARPRNASRGAGAARSAMALRARLLRRDEGRVAVGDAPLRGVRRMKTLRVVAAMLRASLALALQYRLEFVVQSALAFLWMAVALIPLMVVFGTRGAVAGWTYAEMLVVLGWFVALKGVLEGTLSPSLMAVV